MNNYRVIEEFLKNLSELITVFNKVDPAWNEYDVQMQDLLNMMMINPKKYNVEDLQKLIEYNTTLVKAYSEYKQQITLEEQRKWIDSLEYKFQDFSSLTEYVFISSDVSDKFQEIIRYMETNNYEFSRKQSFKFPMMCDTDYRRNRQLISYFVNLIKDRKFKEQFPIIMDDLIRVTEETKVVMD